MDLRLDHYVENGIQIIDAEGEIDVYTAPRLRELLIELVSTGAYHLVVNMQHVEFLDSTGLGVLVGGLKRIRAHDGSMSLVCSQERILKIFRITGLTKVFGIFDTVEEAIAVSARSRSHTADHTASSVSSQDHRKRPFRRDEAGSRAAEGSSGEQQIPIRIYLENAEAAAAVEDAIRTILAESGVAVIDEGPPIAGSWYKRLGGQLKQAADSDAAAKAQRALEMQVLDRFQAGIDGVTGDAVAKLITALENTSGAVLQVGSVLLVKVDDTVIVRQLTQVELLHWQRNPGLFKDPATALAELQRAAQADPNGQHSVRQLPRADGQ